MHTRRTLVLLLVAAGGVRPAASALTYSVADGQQLAGAAYTFGKENRDTTVVLDAPVVSLLNATFRHATDAEAGGKAYSNGTLLIEGGRGASWSTTGLPVLDTAMRAALTPPLVAAAQVVFSRLSLVNLCVAATPLGGEFIVLGNTPLGLVSLAPVRKSLTLQNVHWFTPSWNLHADLYVCGVQRLLSVFPSAKARHPVIGDYNDMGARIERTGQHTAVVHSLRGPGMLIHYLFEHATNEPNDPLLASMRRNGTLMHPAFCRNGSRVPPELGNDVTQLLSFGPLWVGDDAAEALGLLRRAAALALAQQQQQYPVPVLLLHPPRLTLGERAAPGGLGVLEAPLMLWGPFNDVPESTLMPVPVLDLTGRTSPLFAVRGQGQLLVTRLAIQIGPAQGSSGDDAPPPLATLAAAASTGDAAGDDTAPPAAILYNVTLLLPALDVLALLALATDGTPQPVRPCLGPDATARAAAWRGGVGGVNAKAVLRQAAADWGVLRFAGLEAGGINATALLVRPWPEDAGGVARLAQECTRWRQQQQQAQAGGPPGSGAPAAAAAAAGGDGGPPVGLIVGCTVGGVVGLALVGLAAWTVVTRSRRRARQRPPSSGGGPLTPGMSYGLDALHLDAAHAKALEEGSMSERRSAQTSPSEGATSAAAQRPSPPASLVGVVEESERRLISQLDAAAALKSFRQALQPAPQAASSGGGEAPGTTAALLREAHERILRDLQPSLPPSAAAPPSQLSSTAALPSLMPSSRAAQPSQPPSRTLASLGEEEDEAAGGRAAGAAAEAPQVHPLQAVRQAVSRMLSSGSSQPSANQVTLHAVLGRGGSGIVYLGEWRNLPVAVKTMVFEAGGGAGGGGSQLEHQRAVMETAIAASVGHPNLVATYHYDIKRVGERVDDDAGSGLQICDLMEGSAAPPQPPGAAAPLGPAHAAPPTTAYKVFLIQELCTLTLRTALGHTAGAYRPVQSNLAMAMSLLLDVAQALRYLHAQGIIHGDLTPSNVLLKMGARHGQATVVAKLSDFGLSMRLGPQATHVSNFKSGTPFYVAPEVVSEHRTSPAADIFAFGVVSWEVLTGQQPFVQARDGGEANEWNEHFPMFEGTDVPEGVVTLVHRCLQRVPRQRPGADELVRTLISLLAALGA